MLICLIMSNGSGPLTVNYYLCHWKHNMAEYLANTQTV